METVGHSRLLKYLIGGSKMASKTTHTLKIEDLNPSPIESKVPEHQNLRETKANPTLNTKPKVDNATEQNLQRESKILQGEDKIKQSGVPRKIINPVYSEIIGEVIENQRIRPETDVETSREDKPIEEKPKTRIPVSRFKQTADKVKRDRKESGDGKDLSSIRDALRLKRSSIPRFNDSKIPPPSKKENETKEKTNEDNVQVDDEFDKLYDEIVDTEVSTVPDEILSTIKDPEQLENTFEEIVHAYDESEHPSLEPVNKIDVEERKTDKGKHSKIPLFRRQSEQDITVPKNSERRQSLKTGDLKKKDANEIKNPPKDIKPRRNVVENKLKRVEVKQEDYPKVLKPVQIDPLPNYNTVATPETELVKVGIGNFDVAFEDLNSYKKPKTPDVETVKISIINNDPPVKTGQTVPENNKVDQKQTRDVVKVAKIKFDQPKDIKFIDSHFAHENDVNNTNENETKQVKSESEPIVEEKRISQFVNKPISNDENDENVNLEEEDIPILRGKVNRILKRLTSNENDSNFNREVKGQPETNGVSKFEEDMPLFKGKVSNLINRLDSNEPNDNIKEVVHDIPKKKSVLSKIAMFEQTAPNDPVPKRKFVTHKPEEIHQPKIIHEVLKPKKEFKQNNTYEAVAIDIYKPIEVVNNDTNEQIVVVENIKEETVIYKNLDIKNRDKVETEEEIIDSEFDFLSDDKEVENKPRHDVIENVNSADENRVSNYNIENRYEKDNRMIHDLSRRINDDENTIHIENQDHEKHFRTSEKNYDGVNSFNENKISNNIENRDYNKNNRMANDNRRTNEKPDNGLKNSFNENKISNNIENLNHKKDYTSVHDMSRRINENTHVVKKDDKKEKIGNFDVQERLNRYLAENTNLKKAKSTAELDLGDSVKGKVRSMIVRMNSVELLEDKAKEVIKAKEAPRKRSVSEKIALFERKLTPVKMDDVQVQARALNVNTKIKTDSPNTIETEDARSNRTDYEAKILELNNAKMTYGSIDEMSFVELSDGHKMPVIAIGTALLDPLLIKHIVGAAIDLGYRAFDTAFIYGNEREVGEGIRAKIQDGTVKREDLFISSKLWSTYHQPELVEEACRASLQATGLDYFDLYMIHNPMSLKEGGEPIPKIANVLQFSTHDYLDAWIGMEKVARAGLVRSIGVSNFNSQQVARVVEKGKIRPVVNQVECHPYLNQQRLSEFCEERGVILSCYGVLGSKGTPAELKSCVASVIDDPLIQVMAAGLNITTAQLLIRYQIECGHNVVVKSSSAAHLWDNLQALKTKLDPTQVDALHALNKNKRTFTFKGMGDTHKNYPFTIPF